MVQARINNPIPLYPSPADGRPPSGRYLNVGRAERWISAGVGGLLATVGLRRGRWLTAALGGVLLYRGATGHCPLLARLGIDRSEPEHRDPAIDIREVLTVYAPREVVYARWRNFERLPDFMHHLESVTVLDDRRSHWVARVPKDLGAIEWDAEMTEDAPPERLAWRSLPGADIFNAGTVRFEEALGGAGTIVYVNITYRPPAGEAGAAVLGRFTPVFSRLVKEDVRRFRSLVEAGEVPTTEGQPAGR